MSYAELFRSNEDGHYQFSLFCDRCLRASIEASPLDPADPEGPTTAVVEVGLDFARRLHKTWVGGEQPEPRRAGDFVGWCEQARVVVARETVVAGAQLELFGAAT